MRTMVVVTGLALLGVMLSPLFCEANVKLHKASDVIYLRNGTEVKGTILMQASKAVIVMTEEAEETIPMADVARIVRDQRAPLTTLHATTMKDGHIQIVPGAIKEEDASTSVDTIPAATTEEEIDLSVDLTGAEIPPELDSLLEKGKAQGIVPTAKEMEIIRELEKVLDAAKKNKLLPNVEATEK